MVVEGDKTVIKGTGENVDPEEYYTGATDGSSTLTETGDAIYIESGYNDRDISVAVQGGTISSVNAKAIRMFVKNGESTTSKRDVAVTGGTFSSDVSAYVPDGYIQNNGKVEELTLDNAVAKIGETPYKTLKAAVNAATADDDTVTLLKDVTGMTTIRNTVTIDLNGHSVTQTVAASKANSIYPALYVYNGNLTLDDTSAGKTGKVVSEVTATTVTGAMSNAVYVYNGSFTLKNGSLVASTAAVHANDVWDTSYGVYLNAASKFTMVNGSITATADDGGAYGVAVLGQCEFTMENGSIDASGFAISGNGSASEAGTTITIKNGTVTGGELAIYHPQSGTLTIEGGKLTGKGGIETKAGNTTVTIDGNPTITATGTPKHEANGNGNSSEGYAISVVENKGYAGGATVTIGSGCYKGEISILQDNEVPAEKKGSITINGGNFTSDPSAYCDADHTGVASGNVEYPYTVGEKNAEAKPAHVDSATVPAGTAQNASQQVQEVAKKMSAGAALSNNAASEAAAKDLANNNKITAATKVDGSEKTVTETLNEKTSQSVADDNVAIVYQTYIDVTVADAKQVSVDNITEITVDMTPMYRVVATTKTVVEGNTEIKADGDNKNAVVIEAGKKLTVPTGKYEVKLAIPSALARENDKLAIKHTKDNGTVEFYTGTVTKEGDQLYVTFTTNGFSPFTIYAADANVAQIGEDVYISLDDAIKAVPNGGTIKLLKDNLSGTVSRAVSFTLTAASTDLLEHVKLTAGAGYSLKKEGNTYTATYVGYGTTPTQGLPFTDVSKDSPYYDGIRFVYEKGIMKGVTATTFEPGTAVTRGMLVTLLYRNEGSPAVTGASFSDVAAGRYFTDAVAWAAKNGIVTGFSDGTFRPDAPVSRQQLAVILFRYAGYKGMTAVTLEENLNGFTDESAISGYAISAMNWAVGQGLVNGFSDGSVRPTEGASRAQTATVLMRLLQNVLG